MKKAPDQPDDPILRQKQGKEFSNAPLSELLITTKPPHQVEVGQEINTRAAKKSFRSGKDIKIRERKKKLRWKKEKYFK